MTPSEAGPAILGEPRESAGNQKSCGVIGRPILDRFSDEQHPGAWHGLLACLAAAFSPSRERAARPLRETWPARTRRGVAFCWSKVADARISTVLTGLSQAVQLKLICARR